MLYAVQFLNYPVKYSYSPKQSPLWYYPNIYPEFYSINYTSPLTKIYKHNSSSSESWLYIISYGL